VKVKKIVYMKNKFAINDLNGLKARQMALLAESDMHAEAVLLDSKSYVKDFSLSNLVKKKPESVLNLDVRRPASSSVLSGKILALALPIILNKTIFKKSGFITKAAVTFISSKTGAKIGGRLMKYINRLRK
jgi:hypothetical protein